MRKQRKGQYQMAQINKELEKQAEVFRGLQELILQQCEVVEELNGSFRRVAKKEDRELYKLLKGLVQWRVNMEKMVSKGSDVALAFAKLDDILEEANVVMYRSRPGTVFDGNRHLCVGIAEGAEIGTIAESVAQGYMWKESVLLEEEVIVYK